MGINQLNDDLKELKRQKSANLSQQLKVLDEILNGNKPYEAVEPYFDEFSRLRREERDITRAIEANRQYYRRPSGKISGLFSRVLGPLPTDLRETNIDDDARKVMASLPSYRFAAPGLLVGVVTTLVTISILLPQLMISPFSLFMSAASVEGSSRSEVLMIALWVIALIILAIVLRDRKNARNFIYVPAHEEEKWFRSGAENWTLRQRTMSCLSFGTCHVVNIIYPFITLLVLSLAGAAFMAAYLAEYRRSGDVHRATLASTKLHARYNTYAFGLMGVGLVALTIISFV